MSAYSLYLHYILYQTLYKTATLHIHFTLLLTMTTYYLQITSESEYFINILQVIFFKSTEAEVRSSYQVVQVF